MTCPTCQAQQLQPEPDQQPAVFCCSCDAPLCPVSELKRCDNCSAINPVKERFCLSCGSVALSAVSDELPFNVSVFA